MTGAENLPLTSLWSTLASPGVDAYIQAGGYGAAIETARKGGREVIRALREADVRSRDGAGTPLYLTWRACQSAPAETKYLLCLAEDPDSGAPIYRELMLKSPHLVLEGMICAGPVLGATQGLIYVREDDLVLQDTVNRAIDEARANGFLGEDALLEIQVITGSRSFLCGGEGTDLRYVEALLRDHAPEAHGYTSGLFGWPTVVHDPETWAQVPLLLGHDPEWYRALGLQGLSGTKLIHLHGAVKNRGLFEVPLGTTLEEILDKLGQGEAEGTHFKALQLGGPSGGFAPDKLLPLPLDFEVLSEYGLSMSSGGMEVLDDTVCIVARTLEMIFDCMEGNCSEVEACRLNLNRIKRLLAQIEEGRGSRSHLENLTRLGREMLGRDPFGSQRSVARPLTTSLTYFLHDYIHHIEQGVCAVGTRSGLTAAPCQTACPAGIDVPSYVALISEGKFREALDVVRQDNPLASICGMVCTHPCESACTRGEMDKPISIMALKGFAARWVMENGGYSKPLQERPREEMVAVVGAGPAGLSAAHFLALKGYQVTIFEALPVAGGEMAVGIPSYRLPSSVIQLEVEAIMSLGVELITGIRVGRDLTLDELRGQGYKAFFLGVGAQSGMKLGIEGESSHVPVLDALTFLKQVRMGRKTRLAQRVVVVGGGNAAIDAARTCLRLGTEQVYIAYRRTRMEMPAWEEEIIQAEEEGVKFHYLTIPKEIIGHDGHVTGLACLKAELGEPDASGRRRPVPILDSDFTLEVGAVITAIGQKPDIECIKQRTGVLVSDRDRIVVNKETLQTTEKDVFAGGDVVTGPATVVKAVAAGKWAAQSIHAYLQGQEIPKGPPARQTRAKVEPPQEMDAVERSAQHRAIMPLLDMEQRKHTFKQVELGLPEEAAVAEALRCLRCDLCVGCGICQMVCEEMGVKGLQLTQTAEGRLAMTDFHRPARACIGCGSCVQVCPHKNIRMMDSGDHRRIIFCGTQTAKLKLQTCESCGKTLAPEAYLGYLKNMEHGDSSGAVAHRLCPECARKRWAEGQMGDVLWFPPSSGD